ncbi:hypothetical protein [Solicola sp. PLA-1-18]|uniref:hypothetical protein n=1 Tax=Solicola sp. PLA-1-18 TaxID=3380532 RepID=UPI003B7AA478
MQSNDEVPYLALPQTVRANYFRGWRALGGQLTLTATNLKFAPHGFERSLGGDTTVEVPVREITDVSVKRGGPVPRKRLFIQTRDGAISIFLLPRVQTFAQTLRGAISEAGGVFDETVPVTTVSTEPSGVPGFLKGWLLAIAVAYALLIGLGAVFNLLGEVSIWSLLSSVIGALGVSWFLWVAWIQPAIRARRSRRSSSGD